MNEEDGPMNTKEAAKKWGISVEQVRKYCADGMVFFAEKVGRDWYIPDGADRPKISRNIACKLMSMIDINQEGNKPSFQGCGFSVSQIDEYYEYLADNGFISDLTEGLLLSEKLKLVKILNRGKELIEKFNESNPSRMIKVSAELYAEVNVGTFKAGTRVNIRQDS